jgi:WD40 repeat protein
VHYCIVYKIGVHSYKYCASTIATLGLYILYTLSDYALQQGHSARVFHVHWSPLLHGVLASGSDDQSVRVWDVCGTLGSLCGASPTQHQQQQLASNSTSNSSSKRSSVGGGSVNGGSTGSAGSDNSSDSSGVCCAVLQGHRHNVSTYYNAAITPYIQSFLIDVLIHHGLH